MQTDPVFDPDSEMTADEWAAAYTIEVGTAYACAACGTVVMVSRSGVGNFEPACCGAAMRPVERKGAC